MSDTAIPQFVFEGSTAIQPVGSRVTCFPPVMDTDQDFLVLEAPGITLEECLKLEGWTVSGSEIRDEANTTHPDHRFVSMKFGNTNIILTSSVLFFNRFMAATSVAKRLNLLSKSDRIALFQAVLYGNECADDTYVEGAAMLPEYQA